MEHVSEQLFLLVFKFVLYVFFGVWPMINEISIENESAASLFLVSVWGEQHYSESIWIRFTHELFHDDRLLIEWALEILFNWRLNFWINDVVWGLVLVEDELHWLSFHTINFRLAIDSSTGFVALSVFAGS